MPSSSFSSRINAISGRSPGSTLPPGNSHSPPSCLSIGRFDSSTRPSLSIRATAATRTIFILAAVGAVDVDVTVREIAGPYGGLAFADADIRLDDDMAALHVWHDLGF